MITPLVSSDPKLGTNAGGVVAYLKKMDEKSPISMFGIGATYSDTESYVATAFAKLYFDEDKQRLIAAYALGEINNQYTYERGDKDFILSTTDDIKMVFARYSYRIFGNWFVGFQAVKSNYIISGGDPTSQKILDLLDLVGFDSGAIGLVATYDSRDNQESASSGHNFVLHQFAHRESFGGNENYDSYQGQYSTYFAHGEGHVLGINAKGRWTNNAPNSGYSSINLRGYIKGQYLAEHSSYVEVEERYSLKGKWGLTAFVGLGCLYGDNLAGRSLDCTDSDNQFPSIGGGLTYQLKPEERIIVKLEAAAGKEGN